MSTRYALDVMLAEKPSLPETRPSPEIARQQFRDAQRIQDSFLAAAEKKTLLWLAERTPPAVNSDHLTALGMIAMIVAGAGFAAARWNRWTLLAVPVCLALNWLGDSLDGTLARFRQQPRPRYGFYVDHVVDALGTFAMFAGMAVSHYMSPWTAAGLLVAYLLLMIEAVLATYTLGVFRIAQFRMSPTELRILLSIGSLVLLVKPVVHLFGGSFLLFDVGGVIGASGMALLILLSFIRNTRTLYLQERIL
jgi:phosphatidylglycerophosphate synthase